MEGGGGRGCLIPMLSLRYLSFLSQRASKRERNLVTMRFYSSSPTVLAHCNVDGGIERRREIAYLSIAMSSSEPISSLKAMIPNPRLGFQSTCTLEFETSLGVGER
jgi:hypothetical protein